MTEDRFYRGIVSLKVERDRCEARLARRTRELAVCHRRVDIERRAIDELNQAIKLFVALRNEDRDAES